MILFRRTPGGFVRTGKIRRPGRAQRRLPHGSRRDDPEDRLGSDAGRRPRGALERSVCHQRRRHQRLRASGGARRCVWDGRRQRLPTGNDSDNRVYYNLIRNRSNPAAPAIPNRTAGVAARNWRQSAHVSVHWAAVFIERLLQSVSSRSVRACENATTLSVRRNNVRGLSIRRRCGGAGQWYPSASGP